MRSLITFTSIFEQKVSKIKSGISETMGTVNEVKSGLASIPQGGEPLEAGLKKLSDKLHQLEDTTIYFKVSEQDGKKEI